MLIVNSVILCYYLGLIAFTFVHDDSPVLFHLINYRTNIILCDKRIHNFRDLISDGLTGKYVYASHM